MSDLISRQSAIEAILEDKIDSKSLEIMRMLGDGMRAQTLNDTCDRHAQIIKTLPSPESERKKGKWIELDDDPLIRCICSACGWKSNLYENDVYGMPYCPNCGADMREEA